MSWFDTTGFASLAKSALSTAQKTIDKALDIQDDKSRNIPVPVQEEKEEDSFFAAFGIIGDKSENPDSPTVVREPVTAKQSDQSKSGLWGDWGSFSVSKIQADTSSVPEPKKTRLSDPEPTIATDLENTVLLQPQRDKLLFPGEETVEAEDILASTVQTGSPETTTIAEKSDQEMAQEQKRLTVSMLLAEMTPLKFIKGLPRKYQEQTASQSEISMDSASSDAKGDVQLDLASKSIADASHAMDISAPEQDLTGSTSSNDLTLTEHSDGDVSPATSTMRCEIFDMSPTDYCIVDQPYPGKQSPGSSPITHELYQSEMSSSCSASMEIIHENDIVPEVAESGQGEVEKKKGPTTLLIFENENLNSQYSSPDSVIAVLDEVHSTLPSPYYPDIHIIPGNTSMCISTDFGLQQGESSFLSPPSTGQSPDSDRDSIAVDPEGKCESEPNEECETSSSGSKGSRTSSGSFVNCSVEEADNCYRETSPSSTVASERSDAMRRGGEFSGHTSGDEIETATSSDIEIISPPNGENDRHPTSPMKNIWAPRPHRLRCSESPASDGGKDIMPVLHEREEFLRPGSSSQLSSREVAEVMEGEAILKRVVALQELLDAREGRVLDLSKENVDLQEENSFLKSRIQKMEESHFKDSEDVSKLTKEFSQRLSQAEASLREATTERDTYKQQLQEIEAEAANRPSAAVMETMITERDQQISELRQEGEKLSKQQLQLSTIIKKLRNKEKENEVQIKTQREKLEERSKELERLRKSLGAKDEQEKKHIDAIRQLTANMQKQDDEINNLKSELEDANDKLRSTKNAMDSAYKELTSMQKKLTANDSMAQEAAISAEMAAKEEVRHQLQHAQEEAIQERETLLLQIAELRQTLTGVEHQAYQREEALKADLASLHKRLQESDSRQDELTQDVSFATRPLLRQIENLQSAYSIQSAQWEKAEKSLLDRLNASQRQLALTTEKECSTTAQLTETFSKLSALESEKRFVQQEKSHLLSQLDLLKNKVAVLEESRNREAKAQENLKTKFAEEMTSLKQEKDYLMQKIEALNEWIENAKKKEHLEQQTDVQQSAFSESERSSPTPSITISQRSSISRDAGSELNIDQPHLYENWWGTGATSTIENLQCQVKRKEGEISQLQSEITHLERIRSSMADELVALVRRNEQLEGDVQEVEALQSGFTDLEQKYNTLLQMYGEKVEEVEELRLDLSDIKSMYRIQLDELMKRS